LAGTKSGKKSITALFFREHATLRDVVDVSPSMTVPVTSRLEVLSSREKPSLGSVVSAQFAGHGMSTKPGTIHTSLFFFLYN